MWTGAPAILPKSLLAAVQVAVGNRRPLVARSRERSCGCPLRRHGPQPRAPVYARGGVVDRAPVGQGERVDVGEASRSRCGVAGFERPVAIIFCIAASGSTSQLAIGRPCRLPIRNTAPRVDKRTWLWTVTSLRTTAPTHARSRDLAGGGCPLRLGRPRPSSERAVSAPAHTVHSSTTSSWPSAFGIRNGPDADRSKKAWNCFDIVVDYQT